MAPGQAQQSVAAATGAHAALSASTAVDRQHAEQLTRRAILMMLSDGEVARVSTAEGMVRLSRGEEYLDLKRLDQGVHRNLRATELIGRLLPRRAVHAQTWIKILRRLAMVSSASGG